MIWWHRLVELPSRLGARHIHHIDLCTGPVWAWNWWERARRAHCRALQMFVGCTPSCLVTRGTVVIAAPAMFRHVTELAIVKAIFGREPEWLHLESSEVHHDMSWTVSVWMVNGLVTTCDSWIWDQHTGRGGSLPLTSEFVWSNGHVRNLLIEHLGAVSRDNGNWTWFLVIARTIGPMCCTLRCTWGSCLMIVVLLAVVCLTSMSLSAVSTTLKQGRCAVVFVRQKRSSKSVVLRCKALHAWALLVYWVLCQNVQGSVSHYYNALKHHHSDQLTFHNYIWDGSQRELCDSKCNGLHAWPRALNMSFLKWTI